jgi:hypothetical protein
MISPSTAAIIGKVLNIMDLSQRYSQDMLVGFHTSSPCPLIFTIFNIIIRSVALMC